MGPQGVRVYTDDERRLSKQIIYYWTNFVKTGDPNGNGYSSSVNWPTYYSSEESFNTYSTSIWGYLYGFFFKIFKYIFPNLASTYDSRYLIIKVNDTKVLNKLTYFPYNMTGIPRRCSFWQYYENL